MSNRSRASSTRPLSVGRNAGAIKVNGQHQLRKRVGHYLIGDTVGEGTFGKVKIAVHIPTGEKVAVKILEKRRIQDQADVRRVNREIKILKKAKHRNIIQLYEVLDTPNTIYLMMENADGGELFDYIVAHRHVPERLACTFFHQIINGVEALHVNEITHRDLKPENLLLKSSADGWILKIVDFGLSNTHEGNKLLSTACGSPCYAAPEMIAGKQYKGPVADIWSMGVILFALVAGFLPFEDPNTSQLYRKILIGEYKPPKWISPEVKDLLRKILETDPNKRYTVNDIRKHSWYCMVPESSIPKDCGDVYTEDDITAEECILKKNDILKVLSGMGMDSQTVLDAVASRACNSLSAMYYLVAQRERANLKLEKKGKYTPLVSDLSNRTDISASSRPETSSHVEGSLRKPGTSYSGEYPKLKQNTVEIPTLDSPGVESPCPDILVTTPATTVADEVVDVSLTTTKAVQNNCNSIKRVANGRSIVPKLNITKKLMGPGKLIVEGQLSSQTCRLENSRHIKVASSQQGGNNLQSVEIHTARADVGRTQTVSANTSPNITVTQPHIVGVNSHRSPPKDNTIDMKTGLNYILSSEKTREKQSDKTGGLESPIDAVGYNLERPVTRRSKSREKREAVGEVTGSAVDGPGLGMIPVVPKDRRRSGSSGGRRGHHIAANGRLNEHSSINNCRHAIDNKKSELLVSDKTKCSTTVDAIISANLLSEKGVENFPGVKGSTQERNGRIDLQHARVTSVLIEPLSAKDYACKNKVAAQGTYTIGVLTGA